MNKPRVPAKGIYAATVIALLTFGAGFAFAAISVSPSTETGQGNYVNTASIAWWSLSASNPGAVAVVPSTVPTSLSTTIGTPTVLPASATSYMVGSGTAGHIAQVMKFTETTAAPINTEVEVTVTVNAASTTTTTVYIETQSAAPSANIVFTLYIDVGDASAATITINYAEQISQQCSSVGSCP